MNGDAQLDSHNLITLSARRLVEKIGRIEASAWHYGSS